MFMMLCKANRLNPWNREAYCIKYGNAPATMVIGKEAFLKRAESDPQYDGMESGIIAQDEQTGDFSYRQGCVVLDTEKLIGGWAEVYRKDRKHSCRVEVPFSEYVGKKSDGSVNGQWSAKPATMIRKVAQVQALREAFPNTAPSGIYTAEEQGQEEQDLPPVIQPDEEQKPAQEAPKDVPDPEITDADYPFTDESLL